LLALLISGFYNIKYEMLYLCKFQTWIFVNKEEN